MDLQQANGAVAKSEPAKEQGNKVAQNGEAKKENGKAQAEKAKTAPPKADEAKPQEDMATSEPPKAAEPKAQAEPVKVVPFALNLEATLKAVEALHRKSIQRESLIARIKQLEEFEVKLETENDELDENPYQGCKLIIEDDKRRQFVTKTPGLIRLVAQFIFEACAEKLAEIEANIVFPKA